MRERGSQRIAERERGKGLERRENAAIGKGRKTKNEERSAILLIGVEIKTVRLRLQPKFKTMPGKLNNGNNSRFPTV